MTDNDKKIILLSKLGFHYNGDIHTLFELSTRKISSSIGGLCGMAAVYQAAIDTVLTMFQIKSLTFDELKATLLSTMGRSEKYPSDFELLENYYSCK